ncbi:MAG TPA: hypothetical protein VG742_01840 [Dongiaceae bacterium]|nr:hypothetical protein [Dongiaceae bacterium]
MNSLGPVEEERPATTPFWSMAERFWLSFFLPSMLSMVSQTPTIA